MAKSTLFSRPKFKRLCARLGLPRPYVRGLLDTLWDTAHEVGDPAVGTLEDVEAAAEWPGTEGEFANALVDLRFLDPAETEGTDVTDRDGSPSHPSRWELHDYFDHAPEYATQRGQRENARRISRVCEGCGNEFRSSDPRRKHCSTPCRKRVWRRQCGATERTAEKAPGRIGTDRDGCRRIGTDVDGTPLPRPREEDFRGSPSASSTSQNSRSGSARATPGGGEDDVEQMLRIYSTLPGTPRRKPTAADRAEAAALLELTSPTICRAALLLGAQRKNGDRIGSVAYFRPLVEELRLEPPAYAEYVIQALQSGRAVLTTAGEPHDNG